MKIAFIIGPTGPEWQDTYYDKFPLGPKRPWLNKVPAKYHIDDNGFKWNKTTSGPFVRIDVAVGYCVKYMLPKHDVDIVPVDTLLTKSLKSYDIVCNQYMDLLIVPFVKKLEKKGYPHEKLRLIYEENKHKIYPPVNYQTMVYNKCAYYDYLRYNNISVPNMLCVSRHDFEVNPLETVRIVQAFAIANKYDSLFAKPVGGTDSIDIKHIGDNYKVTDSRFNREVKEYMKHIFKQKRYPLIVIQPFFADFETSVPQIRTYFVGDRFEYAITNQKDQPDTVVDKAHPMYQVLRKQMIPIAKKVLRALNPLYNNYPKLVTRIDFGCCLNKANKTGFFVNEIEFAPGMYLHMNRNKFNMDSKIAKQFVNVVNEFSKRRVPFS